MSGAVPARARKFGVALIPGLLLVGAWCELPFYCFKGLKIDPQLHLIVSGGVSPVGSPEPAVGQYYIPFHGAWTTSVEHFVKRPGAVGRERELFLETDQNQVLDRTVKDDEILRGPFGTVNATKECFYTRPIENGGGSVSLEFNGNDLEHELPSEVSKPTEGLPALTSISLVRIFRTSPEFVIVSANYERDGSLGSLNSGASKDGSPAGPGPSGTWMYRTGDPQVDDLQRRELGPLLTQYGIPTHIDVQKYLLSGLMPLPVVALTQERNVMNEFYGYGKLIRQDELKDGTIVASRFLQPSVTDEERETLNSLCEARFRQQEAMGLPTVR